MDMSSVSTEDPGEHQDMAEMDLDMSVDTEYDISMGMDLGNYQLPGTEFADEDILEDNPESDQEDNADELGSLFTQEDASSCSSSAEDDADEVLQDSRSGESNLNTRLLSGQSGSNPPIILQNVSSWTVKTSQIAGASLPTKTASASLITTAGPSKLDYIGTVNDAAGKVILSSSGAGYRVHQITEKISNVTRQTKPNILKRKYNYFAKDSAPAADPGKGKPDIFCPFNRELNYCWVDNVTGTKDTDEEDSSQEEPTKPPSRDLSTRSNGQTYIKKLVCPICQGMCFNKGFDNLFSLCTHISNHSVVLEMYLVCKLCRGLTTATRWEPIYTKSKYISKEMFTMYENHMKEIHPFHDEMNIVIVLDPHRTVPFTAENNQPEGKDETSPNYYFKSSSELCNHLERHVDVQELNILCPICSKFSVANAKFTTFSRYLMHFKHFHPTAYDVHGSDKFLVRLHLRLGWRRSDDSLRQLRKPPVNIDTVVEITGPDYQKKHKKVPEVEFPYILCPAFDQGCKFCTRNLDELAVHANKHLPSYMQFIVTCNLCNRDEKFIDFRAAFEHMVGDHPKLLLKETFFYRPPYLVMGIAMGILKVKKVSPSMWENTGLKVEPDKLFVNLNIRDLLTFASTKVGTYTKKKKVPTATLR